MNEAVMALLGVAMAAALSFWGWLAVKVVDLSKKLVELESRVCAQEHRCTERLEWIRNMEKVLSQVAEDTMAIRTTLGESPHA